MLAYLSIKSVTSKSHFTTWIKLIPLSLVSHIHQCEHSLIVCQSFFSCFRSHRTIRILVLKIQWIHPSVQQRACLSLNSSCPSYHFHNDAVWGSAREHKAEVSRCSHQSSFILKSTKKHKMLQIKTQTTVQVHRLLADTALSEDNPM